MKILSMTATFGKLVNETLTLEQGLNVIHAPNEWGKSTWCAFLETMLYGIDTGLRTRTGYLADKEHYAPWSGEPMSGRMEILWQGRRISVERKSKGRIPMGDVKAYETETGIPVQELSVTNWGEVVLGVERSVFVRAGFLKQSQMPVTEDEKLRRRLNALVTTGDESDAADRLAQQLRDLKNRCRFNKKGLLPEAEAEKEALEEKLRQLQTLQEQTESILKRQQLLKERARLLENHRKALLYEENRVYEEKRTAAKLEQEMAVRQLQLAEANAAGLPREDIIQTQLEQLEGLRDMRESLLMEAQLMPPAPEPPQVQEVFRGQEPDRAQKDAALDEKVLQQLKNDAARPIPVILGAVLLLVGLAGLAVITAPAGKIGGGILLLMGILLLVLGTRKKRNLQVQIDTLQAKYRGIPEGSWTGAAAQYASSQAAYRTALEAHRTQLADLNRRMEENRAAVRSITGDVAQSTYEQQLKAAKAQYRQLENARIRSRQAEDFWQALSANQKQAVPPEFPDTLTETAEETVKALSENQLEEQKLHRLLGQCQGQMESLGQRENLQTRLDAIMARIEKLEQHYRALTLAQQMQETAARELQRRFAPRISQRAQILFGRLTGGRYQRLSLGRDLSVESAAQGENTLRSVLWRSDGTADQLYLALRLAVAEELTPEAPLVLDDALVRFDDVRLAAAMQVLKEEAAQKQVILFTCQEREIMYAKGEERK